MVDIQKDEIILPESDKAAKFVDNISGWVSRHSRFYGTLEDVARRDGATHMACSDCGAIIPKSTGWLICGHCRNARDTKKFLEMPITKWDTDYPVCIFNSDQYFFESDEIEGYCEDHEIDPATMQLVQCIPVVPSRGIDLDYFEDYLGEEEYPQELYDIITEFNTKVMNYFQNNPVYEQGAYRIEYQEEDEA